MKPTIDVCDDVTLIILQNIPANMGFVTEVFEKIAAMDVDVDMISLAPPKSSQTSLSFTVSDDDLVKILGYTSKLFLRRQPKPVPMFVLSPPANLRSPS